MVGPLIDVETGDVVIGPDGVGINSNGDILVDIGSGVGININDEDKHGSCPWDD